MGTNEKYDLIIIGGGLAGLSMAILMAREKYKVLVIEKEAYPRHKVCGEYISNESKPFLESLGFSSIGFPVIDTLQVTDARGNELLAQLPQGGFGVSRFLLDARLAELTKEAGAILLTKTRVEDVKLEGEDFRVEVKTGSFIAKMVCGSWGRRNNMDVKWQRPFISKRQKGLDNYIAIKYHLNYPWPVDRVGLHNFENGYCGISRIEDGKCCLCYLTTAANLQNNGNDIKQMEKNVLMKNPWLKDIFSEAEFLYESPLAISQISFSGKERVVNHVLLTGDASGVITPLCGNGMSMALHSSKIASELISRFLQGKISRAEMERSYEKTWKANFSMRLAVGRMVQRNFGKDKATAFFLKTMKVLPFMQKVIIRNATGKPF